ncbi:phosphonate ABC transporter ATP-binding protein [Micrococcoides hystricis]|uniref:Phosphonate ABC transporter ATP-binding protein n=1 Tax=Micrococcoides hystricis TaxID=1572761 RepID=A0ABV6P9N7_9MICC
MSRPTAETVIDVQGLTKDFGAHRALDKVSLTIDAGENVVLLGANGSGKSTLLKCLTRLVEPTEGTIHVNQVDVMKCSKTELARLRKHVGVVFQNINLIDQLSVLTNVIHGSLGRAPSIRNWYAATASAEIRAEAMDALARVDLAEIADRRASALSGGQRQRVAIARMLMQQPKIVLADEPVAALDPHAGREVMDLLWEICSEQNLTLVCTLHQLNLAREYGGRMVALREGKIDLDTHMDLVADEQLQDIYTIQTASVGRGSES